MAKNVYIHIPFCKGGKCNYCSFVSYGNIELKDNYLKALKRQIKAEYKGEVLNTLYIGGGTPSLLSVNDIDGLLELFNISDDAEITLEANPDSTKEDYFKSLNNTAINRLSVGAQTFDDKILKLIGRKHNSVQTIEAIKSAKAAGFDNISIDLIYGLPEQDLNAFKKDLDIAVSLGIQHISLYGLKIDEGCYFYETQPPNLPNSDMQADLYLLAVETLKNAGFEHYEISNFAKKGYESKHNLNYWDNNTYYGFGAAASGYLNCIRYTNQRDLKLYIRDPFFRISETKLSKQEIMEESIFLGFRKITGIDVEKINTQFGINFDEKYAKILDKYSEYFIITQKGYALTLEGIMISNEILSEFIEL